MSLYFPLGATLLFFLSFTSPAPAQKTQTKPTSTAVAGLPLALYGTYDYQAYTVFDNTTTEPPTQVQGVGGTLTLRPSGTYEKRFSILASSGPHYFNQDGRFTIKGDSISFAFSDLKGADVQKGTFQYDAKTKRLVLTIIGYPTGNKGVYELVARTPKPAKSKRR